MRPLAGHTNDVRAVAYCPDGRLVSGGSDRTVRVWDPTTGEHLRTLKAGTPVYAVAVSPDGSQFAYAGRHPGADARETPIKTFLLTDDVAGYTFRCPYRTPPPEIASYYPTGIPQSVWALSYSADGRYLVAAGRHMGPGNTPYGSSAFWFRTDDASARGPVASVAAYTARFAPDGYALALTSCNLVAFYTSPHDNEPTVTYPLPAQWAAAVGFVPGGSTAVVGVNSMLHFVDATAQRKPRKVKTGFRTVTAVACPPDGRAVIVGGRPAGVEVYHPDTGALVVRYDFGLGGVNAVAVAPDGLTFAVGGDDGLVVFDWDG